MIKVRLKILFFVFAILGCYSSTTAKFGNTSNGKAPAYKLNYDERYLTSYQSNDHLDFYEFLSGINSVYIITSSEISPTLFNDQRFYEKYRNVLSNYFQRIGLKNTAISENEQYELEGTVPINQTATVELKLDYTGSYLSKVTLSYFSCNKDEFRFSKNVNYYIDETWDTFLFNTLQAMFWHYVQFDSTKSYKINSISTGWNENKIIEYLNNNSESKLEGIYEKYGSSDQYKIALIKKNDLYELIYLSGAKNKFDWHEGDLKGIVRKTAMNDFYKVEWVMSDKTTNKEVYLSTSEEYFLNFEFTDPSIGTSSKYIKMLPVFSGNHLTKPSAFSSSGTGFAISTDGLIITNYHVVENGKSITAQFNEGNNSNSYNAKILIKDKENDIVVLSIIDDNFIPLDSIPYNILINECNIGTSVYTLGYPMIQTMGSSVKLANGIISSLKGFMDNEQFYQVSIPINPGNSGGPLFDDYGNIVGIINAKHSSAESVAYALKSPIVKKVLSKLFSMNSEEENQQLQKKSLPELVRSLQKYVCLIKVN